MSQVINTSLTAKLLGTINYLANFIRYRHDHWQNFWSGLDQGSTRPVSEVHIISYISRVQQRLDKREAEFEWLEHRAYYNRSRIG